MADSTSITVAKKTGPSLIIGPALGPPARAGLVMLGNLLIGLFFIFSAGPTAVNSLDITEFAWETGALAPVGYVFIFLAIPAGYFMVRSLLRYMTGMPVARLDHDGVSASAIEWALVPWSHVASVSKKLSDTGTPADTDDLSGGLDHQFSNALSYESYEIEFDDEILAQGIQSEDRILGVGVTLIPKLHDFSTLRFEKVVLTYLPPERCFGFEPVK